MRPQDPAQVCPPYAQLSPESTSGQIGAPPSLNALKHGWYSAAILLPGDDAQEFQRQRLALFHTYRPQTEDEAEVVESLAEFRWLRRRCRPVQARFDEPVLAPAADAAGRLCEPLGHQRLHSAMDVTVHRQRIERLWHGARARLVELQKLRRQGLIAGAAALPPDCYLDASGEVIGPVSATVGAPLPAPLTGRIAETSTPAPVADAGPVAAPAGHPQAACQVAAQAGGGGGAATPTGSDDRGNWKSWERKETRGEGWSAEAERGKIALSDAASPGASGEPPALARPTEIESGAALPGASGEPAALPPGACGEPPAVLLSASGVQAAQRSGKPPGRPIGGFGARRIFADIAQPTAPSAPILPLTSPTPLPILKN